MKVWGEAILLKDLICWFVAFMSVRVWQPLIEVTEGQNDLAAVPLGMGTGAPVIELYGERLSRGPTPCNSRSDL